MHYLLLIGIGVASWRLTENGAWDAFWYGFIALLAAGAIAEWADRRRLARARRRQLVRRARYDR